MSDENLGIKVHLTLPTPHDLDDYFTKLQNLVKDRKIEINTNFNKDVLKGLEQLGQQASSAHKQMEGLTAEINKLNNASKGNLLKETKLFDAKDNPTKSIQELTDGLGRIKTLYHDLDAEGNKTFKGSKTVYNPKQLADMQDSVNANKIKMLSSLEHYKGKDGFTDIVNNIEKSIHSLNLDNFSKSGMASINAEINLLKELLIKLNEVEAKKKKIDTLDATKSKMLYSLNNLKIDNKEYIEKIEKDLGVKNIIGNLEKQINGINIDNHTKVGIEGIKQEISYIEDEIAKYKQLEKEKEKSAKLSEQENARKQSMYAGLQTKSDNQLDSQLNRINSKINKGSTLNTNISNMLGSKAEADYSNEEKRIVKWTTRYRQLLNEYNEKAKLGIKIDEGEFRKLERFETSIKNLQRTINTNTDSHGYSYTKYGEFLISRLNPAISDVTNKQLYYNHSILEGWTLNEKYVQSTDKYIKVLQKLRKGSDHREIGIYIDKNTGKMYEFADSVRDAMTRSWGLGEAIKTAGEKAFIWTTVMGTLYGVLNILKQIPVVIIEIDKRLTEMHKVLPDDTDYGAVMDKMEQSANRYGRTITETQDAVIEFARMGYDAEQAIKLADTALLGANVTLMQSGELASYLTGAMAQFNVTAEDSARIIDKVNEVDNQFSVTSADLTQAISKAGETAQQFGMTLDELLGAVTAIKTSTRESGTVIGNSLKFMLPRLNSDDTIKALKSIGISTKDITGELRNAGDIYGDVANKWDTLTRSQRTYIAEALAGKHHITRLMSWMDNWKIGIDAVHTSQTSLYSALEENTKHMESIEAHMSQVSSSFQSLAESIGEGGLKGAMIGALDTLRAFIDGLNAFGKAGLGMKLGVTGLIVGLTGFIVGFETLTGAIVTATTAMYAFWTSLGPIGLVVIALSAVIGGLAVYAGKQAEATARTNELNKKVREQTTELKKLNQEANLAGVPTLQQVNDTEARIKQLDKLIGKVKELQKIDKEKIEKITQGMDKEFAPQPVNMPVNTKKITKEMEEMLTKYKIVVQAGETYEHLLKRLNNAKKEEDKRWALEKKNSIELIQQKLVEQEAQLTEVENSEKLIKEYNKLSKTKKLNQTEDKRLQEVKLALQALFPTEFDGTRKSIGLLEAENQKRREAIKALISQTEAGRSHAIEDNARQYKQTMKNITSINLEIAKLEQLDAKRRQVYGGLVSMSFLTSNITPSKSLAEKPNPLVNSLLDPMKGFKEIDKNRIKIQQDKKKQNEDNAKMLKDAQKKAVDLMGSYKAGSSGGGGSKKKSGGGGGGGSKTSSVESEIERFTSALQKAKTEYLETSRLLNRKIDLGIVTGMEKFDEQIRNQESYVDKLFDIPSDLDKAIKDYQSKLIKYKGNTKAYALIQEQIAKINKEKAETVKLQETEIQKLKAMKQNYANLQAIVAKRIVDLKIISGLIKGTDIGDEKLKLQEDKVNTLFESLDSLDSELAQNENVINTNNAKMADLTRKRNASKKNSKEWKEYEKQRATIAKNTITELAENKKLTNAREVLLNNLTKEVGIRDAITEANDKFNKTLEETALKTKIQFGFVKGFDILEQKLDLSKNQLEDYVERVKEIDSSILQLQDILSDKTLSAVDRRRVLALIDTEKKKKDEVLKTLQSSTDEYNKQEDYIKKIIDATEELNNKITDAVEGIKDISKGFKDSMNDVTSRLKLNKEFATDVFGKPEDLFNSIDSAYQEKLLSLEKFKKKIVQTEGEVGAKVSELIDKQAKGTISEAEKIQLDELLKTDKNIQKALMDNGLTAEDVKLFGSQYRIILAIKQKYQREIDNINKNEAFKDSIPYLEKQLALVDAQIDGQREINGLKANEVKLLKIQKDLETVLNDTRFEFITASGEKLLSYDKDRAKELSKELLKQNIQNKIDSQKDYVDNVLPTLQDKEYQMYLDQWSNIQTGEVNVQEAITDTVRTQSELRNGYLDTEIKKIGTLTDSVKDLPSTLPIQQQYNSPNYAQYLATPSTGSYVNNSISVSIGNITLQGQQAESLGNLLKDLALSVISRG